MGTFISVSTYPDKAFLHINIVNEFGYKISTCEMITIEKAKEICFEFNIKPN